jgi:hypothetical protein
VSAGVAYRGYSDQDLVSRAMANLGVSVVAAGDSAVGQWRPDSQSYISSAAGGGYGYGSAGGPAYSDPLSRNYGGSPRNEQPSRPYSMAYDAREMVGSQRSPARGAAPTSPRHTRPAQGSPGRASASRKSPIRTAPGERDYDKPWLAGIRAKPSAGKQAVDEVYRLLREAREAKQLAGVAAAPLSPPKTKGSKVWR